MFDNLKVSVIELGGLIENDRKDFVNIPKKQAAIRAFLLLEV